MITTSIPHNADKVVWMKNPYKPLFCSELKEEVNKRCNQLADFIEEHSDLFKLCSLCNLDSIEELRASQMDGNLDYIGFTRMPGIGALIFLAFWVHPSHFSKREVEVKTVDEFLALAKKELKTINKK